MKIRVIFYKAKWGDGHWIDNAINIWTWLISAKNRKVGDYSHVEIWTPDSDGVFMLDARDLIPCEGEWKAISLPTTKPVGTMFTSTMRDEGSGTVKRPASEVIENVDRWDYCEVEVTDEQYTHIVSCMEIEVDENMGYARKDIWKFIVGDWHKPDDSRNICSEFVNNMLYFTNLLTGFGIVSPRRLAWKLKQAGYEIKSLKG